MTLFKLLALVFMLSAFAVVGQQNDQGWDDEWGDDWDDEPSQAYTLSGFIEGARGQFTNGNDRVGRAQSMNELRGRLELSYSWQDFTLSAQGDTVYDAVLSDFDWQTRELNIQTSLGDNLDVKAGRQVLTWGTGDYLFLNDMFAKDWQSFFAGRDDEYLKAPQDALRVSWYGSLAGQDWILDGVWTPEFTSDVFLTGERFSFYSPLARELVAPGEYFHYQDRYDDQLALRAKTTFGSTEVALYGYLGYWMTPIGQQQVGSGENLAYFPLLNVWGASLVTPLANGLFSTELAYYDSRESDSGSNTQVPNTQVPITQVAITQVAITQVPNSQLRFLAGYSQEIAKSFTLGGQYYLEKTLDYSSLQARSEGAMLVDEYRHLLTVRATYLSHQQKLNWSLFAFASPSDEDFYLRPSVNYRHDDNWQFTLGGNFFGGNEITTFFAQLEDNNNVYLRVRHNF